MINEDSQPRRKSKILRGILLFAACGLLLLAVAILVLSWDASRPAVPPDLVEPPKELLPPAIKGGPARASVAPKPDQRPREVARPKGFKEFIEFSLKRDPSQQSVRDFLEIYRQLDDGRTTLTATWYKVTFKPEVKSGRNVWAPGDPLRPGMADWLREHHNFVEKCLRFAEQAYWPTPTIEDVPTIGRMDLLIPNWSVFFHYARILSAEIQASRDANDLARVQRIGLAMANFLRAMSQQSALNQAFSPILTYMVNIFTGMTRNNLLNNETIKAMRPALTDFHHGVYYKGAFREEIRKEGLVFRKHVLEKLNVSWNSPRYLDKSWGNDYYTFDIRTNYLYLIDLPRLDRMALESMKAMGRARAFKRDGPALLRQFDRFWPTMMAYAQMSYPMLMVQQPLVSPWNDPSLGKDLIRIYYGATMEDQSKQLKRKVGYVIEGETKLNLLRAAVEWRLDHQSVPRNKNTDMAGDHENPWRDPFTEKPLQVDTASSPTLIWSLGPDLKDQKGLLDYDPTNGAASAGDIVIRLPR